MGFSSFFRMISVDGERFIYQLAQFNLGVEAGQLLILTAFLSLIAIISFVVPATSKGVLRKIIAGLSLLLALGLAIEKFPS